MTLTSIQKADLSHVWHPFVQAKTAQPPLAIQSARGIELISEDGQIFWDLISSWWVNLHGHGHPKIANAISKQAQILEHVIFADFTHEPAVQLSKNLTSYLPSDLTKMFFSDNGSTAVEVALKMARQFWYNLGKPEKKDFISFEKAYHGDTFGAMSVGKTSGYFKPFEDLLFPVYTIPFPETWMDDSEVDKKEAETIKTLESVLEKHHQNIAGLIMEPCVQGAAGMRICRPEFIKKITNVAKSYNILIIFDEIVTGFGRTGAFFACLKADTTPDIICLAKGLTGGFLPLSITATTEEVYNAFLGEDHERAFLHGHSYTANPLGCAAGLASLEIFKEEDTLNKIGKIERIHQERLLNFKKYPAIKNCRVIGDIAAFDVQGGRHMNLKPYFFSKGLLLRPLGDTIYLMPPYCISSNELHSAYDKIEDVLFGNCALEHVA